MKSKDDRKNRRSTRKVIIDEANIKPNFAEGKRLNFITKNKPRDGSNSNFLSKGFIKRERHPQEEQYTDENALYFHETDEGFLERNNYLDRQ